MDPELLDRYLAGECSEDEVATVRRYLMAHPEAARGLERFLNDLDAVDRTVQAPHADVAWNDFSARLRSRTIPTRAFSVLTTRTRGWRSPGVVAAGLVAAGMIGMAVIRTKTPPPVAPAAPRPAPTFVTNNRERATLRLPDGTQVSLAPASRLRLAPDFGEERRDVYLDGEAYFDVPHDSLRLFTVFAGNASARDLGTQFLVRKYPEDPTVQVVVRKGAVAMSGVGRLGAGDLGRLDADGQASLRRNVALSTYFSWLDGRLVFRDTPLVEVLRALRRWHDVDVQLADSTLGSLPFTGILTDASFRSSIDLVGLTLGLRVRRDGARVTLEPIESRTPLAKPPATPRP
jgi:ferric-dicitrate binding protein FerR (iron transport regulator)